MAKEQQLIQLFPKYDTDNDGEINQEQFSELVTELGIPFIYPGSINKVIRRLNYENPDKTTINLQQTKEYYNSFETPSKHDIWKAKYSLLEWATQIRGEINKHGGSTGSISSAAPAAPGAESSKDIQENPIQEFNIKLLVGPNKPVYSSEIDIQIEKNAKGPKVKPFVKLTFVSKTVERAKEIEGVFKHNFTTFLKLLAEDLHDWTEEMNNFHINSFVQGTSTTFFITTVNEELVSLIQLFSQLFELSTSSPLQGKAHLRYEFEYNFEDFIKKENSNFYDLFVKESRLTVNAKARHLIKQVRKYLKGVEGAFPNDLIQMLIPMVMLHLDEIDADIEFDSFANDQQYELESKQQINNALEEAVGFFGKLQEGNMTVKQLLQLLDADIIIEASVGEWRVRGLFRLHNLNQIFLKLVQNQEHSSQQQVKYPNEEVTLQQGQTHNTENATNKSGEQISGKGQEKSIEFSPAPSGQPKKEQKQLSQ